MPPSPSLMPTANLVRSVLIYDPASPPSAPELTTRPSEGESKLVLGRLFERYLTDAAKCAPDVNSLEEARRRHQIVPRVLTGIEGSFTARGATEKLYVVLVGECGSAHADNFGTERIVVFRGDSLLANETIAGGSALERIVDLDGDGQRALVLTGGSTGQGYVMGLAWIAAFRQGKLVTVRDFGQVFESNCGTFDRDKSERYTVIRAEIGSRGAPPDFKMEKKRRACTADVDSR
jgi:hypothetical protein